MEPTTGPWEKPEDQLDWNSICKGFARLPQPADYGPLPRLLGKYELQERIGIGGIGVVYKAKDTEIRRNVAIKLMRPDAAGQLKGHARFLTDARIQAACEDENVVPIYDSGEVDGTLFIVMPLLKGETLAERLKREPRPPTLVTLAVGRKAALGLTAVHRIGIIHRDVKPSNLWLEGKVGGPGEVPQTVRLFDLGLAYTLGYASPQQCENLEVDARSDLFSLGVVLYQMVAGYQPFQGSDPLAIISQVRELDPPPPRKVNPAVPGRLSDLIMRLLEKNPDDRPASAAEVERELARIQGWLRWRMWIVVATAVAAAVVALVGGSQLFTAPTDRSDGIPPLQGPAPAVPGSLQPVNHTGSVDLLVFREQNGLPVAVSLSDPQAMPLRPGDHVKLTAEVHPAAYLYLFWIDEKGNTVPMYPWTPFQWGKRSEKGPDEKIEVKDPRGNWIKIGGDTAGMETILMLARSTPLETADDQVKAWFDGLHPLAFPGEKARIWFENFDLLRNDLLRAPEFGDKIGQSGPLGMQDTLRRRIGANSAFSRAVSFARLGGK